MEFSGTWHGLYDDTNGNGFPDEDEFGPYAKDGTYSYPYSISGNLLIIEGDIYDRVG
jgi:hypothetical protein